MTQLPPGLDELQDLVRGTDFAEPLREAEEDQAVVAELLHKPLAEQAAEINRLASASTIDRRELALQNRLVKAHGALRKAIEDGNGLVMARDLGTIDEIIPLDPTNPDSLRQRAAQAKVASAAFGVSVSPILPDEVDAIVNQIDTAPADDVVGILAGLDKGFGENVALNFAAKHPELGIAVFSVRRDPLLAREIVIGARLAKANPDVKPSRLLEC